jgi:hypothetical protein
MAKKGNRRPEMIDNAPMQYAPQNELGVVFLFSHLAKRLRLKVEQIRPGYPDCIAYQKTGRGDRQVRIEFEYRSRNFRAHRHKVKNCDWLVCWEHNWPGVPKRMRVVELRKHFGLGFNVWIVPVSSPYREELATTRTSRWSVPSTATDGDLLLYYSTSPECCLQDIFRMIGPVKFQRSTSRKSIQRGKWKGKWDYFAGIRRVCRLNSPIFLTDLQQDRILRTANFVRARMQGRHNVSEYWPYLYDKIIRRNGTVRSKLKRYSPDRI